MPGGPYMGYYDIYLGDGIIAPTDVRLDATVSMTGSDWRVKTLRISGDDNITRLTDVDAGAGRKIDFVELGYNSEVDLISTRLRYIFGWEGDRHEVNLGNQQVGSTYAINLLASENIVTTGNAFVRSIETGSENSVIIGDTITIGSGGARTVSTGQGSDTVKTTSGYVDFINTRAGNDTVEIGAAGAHSVRTGSGADTVTTGAGWVASIVTDDGNDMVNLGVGFAGQILLGDGNDTVNMSEAADANQLATLRAGSGIDKISFAAFTSGITFGLDTVGQTPAGWIFNDGFENVTGTNHSDTLTGNLDTNVVLGLGGNDKLFGLAGNDTLNGGFGNDRLFGGLGKDKLIGGKGNDLLQGDAGNDVLRGQAGRDIFVFGADSGTDRVMDYVDGVDTLRIADHAGGFDSLSISRSNGNKIIEHDGGTIILDGKGGVTLTASDFDFV